MDNRFHLQRLPIVAIEEVFKLMNPFEIMQFARISKKSKQLVKFVTKFLRFKTSLFIDDQIVFVIQFRYPNYCTKYHYNVILNREGQGTVEYTEIENGSLYDQLEYSKGLEEMKKVVDFANECLNLEMDRFTLDLNQFPGKNHEITNWLKSLNRPMQSIRLRGKDVSHEDVTYCLAHLSTKDWKICVETKNNQPVKVPKPLDCLQIWCAKWVTLEHLLEFDTVQLKIWDGILKIDELKVFLEKFKNLECRDNLKMFSYKVKNRDDFAAVIEDIKNEFVDPEKRLKIENIDEVRQPAVNMKCRDGTIATMYLRVNQDDPVFEMRRYAVE